MTFCSVAVNKDTLHLLEFYKAKPWPSSRIWYSTELREDSIEHLRQVSHTNRERTLLRTPGSSHSGHVYALLFSQVCLDFPDFLL